MLSGTTMALLEKRCAKRRRIATYALGNSCVGPLAMTTDIEIAQKARLQRITDIAKNRLGIDDQHLEPYGHYKAKVSLDYVNSLAGQPDGKLILVTAITPTPAGEGKTTTTVGLGDALNRI